MSADEDTGQPMRVVCIAFDSEELTMRLASALAEHAQVLLILPRQSAFPYLQWLSPKVESYFFDKPRLRHLFRQAKTMQRLVRRIRAFQPDVIHLQKGYLYFSLILPLLARYPLVVSIHDPQHHSGDQSSRNQPQFLLDFAYRRADQVIVHNEAMKQAVIQRLARREERVHVVPLMERGDAYAYQEIAEVDHEILFFGRIWPYKGLDILIQAEPLITAACPDARIVIAGQGEDFAVYREMMVHPQHFVVFNQYVSAGKQAELFRRCSLVVLPYTEATQSGVIPVAYTFGKPVVASAVGGLPSQVEDGVTGLLVPPQDVQALADAVVQLLRDPALRRQMGEQGKRKLEAEWSASVVAKQTLPVYAAAARHPVPVGMWQKEAI